MSAPMVAYRNLCEYKWALTEKENPYVKLRSKRSGLMASIMFMPHLGDRVGEVDATDSDPERTGLYVVRHFHAEHPPFDKQQRNEFATLKDAWKFARMMIA